MLLEEKMLKAWIYMSVNIKENRILTDISFNEMMIMNALDNRDLSFKELQERTNMLKSQLNRSINEMKDKGLIETYIPEDDKRSLIIKKTDYNMTYQMEHQKMIGLMKRIQNEIGEEDSKKLVELINRVTDIIKENTND